MGSFLSLVLALSIMLQTIDGFHGSCHEDEIYWFTGDYTGSFGWERGCVPLDNIR